MNKLPTIIFYLTFPIITFGQHLTVQETLEYISSAHTKYNKYRIHNKGIMSIQYDINGKGFLHVNFFLNNKNTVTRAVHINDLLEEIEFYNEGVSSVIKLKCSTQNCVSYKGSTEYYENDISLYITQEYQAQKIYTAFNYLFSLLNEIDFKRDIDDPFANFNNSVVVRNNLATNRIKLTDQNGTFGIKVNFGDISKSFILDTGASETTISHTLERELISNGFISKQDYLPDGLYKIADGSIITQRRLLIKNLSVGQYSIKNIVVSIGNENSPLLLGKNFLDKFKSWSINNQDKYLELSI
ncbi:Aspartyl protease [Flagellimonas taeanensis]|uniref:Aspartyl protease n=1 Tax=Flagellimonas taeanensis TaxID=1005926 RepID=A0A1M6Y4A7_9FLAO|nr:retropepsin-like aspartic protease [Allomuricauda taeanensis]SFC05312.1 Aspartyl protease [Allomuricauda taeanensis]SHL12988.1 gag-polyprotein putative aspartyl protease [Allomuricauda taeanensis]